MTKTATDLLRVAIEDWETHHGRNYRPEHWSRQARALLESPVPKVTDDARLAVALREEAEHHRVGDSYLHAGELMRDGADAIERLQDVIVSRERALGFTPLPDDPSAEPVDCAKHVAAKCPTCIAAWSGLAQNRKGE